MGNEEENKVEKGHNFSWRGAIRAGWALGLGWLVVILLIIWLLYKAGVLE